MHQYFDDRFFNDMKGFEYLALYYCLEKSSYIYYKSKFAKFSKTYGMRQKENVRIIIVCTKKSRDHENHRVNRVMAAFN